MTKEEAILRSIVHWQEMIAWAKTQPKNEEPTCPVMFDAIGQTWQSEYCALCEYSEIEHGSRTGHVCICCPIVQCGHGNCEHNEWSKVFDSLTWADWIKHANKFLKMLKTLK